MQVDFAGLAGLDATQKTALKDTYEAKSLTIFTAALNNADATVVDTHVYSGALASRRRLGAASVQRRLSGDSGGVQSTFTTTLPAAQADAAQATITTATSGTGALSPAVVQSNVQTELATNAATSGFAANITAAVQPVIVSPVQPVPSTPAPSPASTSGAIQDVLGFASALVLGAVLMF